jgi:hypothetical protein
VITVVTFPLGGAIADGFNRSLDLTRAMIFDGWPKEAAATNMYLAIRA